MITPSSGEAMLRSFVSTFYLCSALRYFRDLL